MGSLSSNATIENMYSFALFSYALVSFTYLIYADLYFWVLVLEAYLARVVLLKLGLQTTTIINNSLKTCRLLHIYCNVPCAQPLIYKNVHHVSQLTAEKILIISVVVGIGIGI